MKWDLSINNIGPSLVWSYFFFLLETIRDFIKLKRNKLTADWRAKITNPLFLKEDITLKIAYSELWNNLLLMFVIIFKQKPG